MCPDADRLAEFPRSARIGTDDLYLEGRLAGLVKGDGQLGIVVPGLVDELTSTGPPERLQRYWEPALFSFHSPAWWKRHWERGGMVTARRVTDLPLDPWADVARMTLVLHPCAGRRTRTRLPGRGQKTPRRRHGIGSPQDGGR